MTRQQIPPARRRALGTRVVQAAGIGIALMVIAAAASWWPARRAMRVNPMKALRS